MKKALALLLMSLLILSVFCSCSFPHAQPDETETQPEPTSAAEETSAPQDEKPFFRLSALPKIGSYYDGTVYKRMTEDYVDSFQPSDKYGAVVPYVGDYRTYRAVEAWEDDEDWMLESKYARYGLMTADGTVITDAVYDYVYMVEDLIILEKDFAGENKDVGLCAILPSDGRWVIEIEDYYRGEGHDIYPYPEQNRIYACDGETLSGYDYNGKKLFATAKGSLSFDVIESTGNILLTNYDGDMNKISMLDKNGKELWSRRCQSITEGTESSRYFACCSPWEIDGENNDCGILDQNGKWVIEPRYKDAYVFGDKYFVYDDGVGKVVLDEDQNTIARLDGSGYDAPTIEWLDGELIYRVYDDITRKSMYYSIPDKKPIMPKDKVAVDVNRIDGTDLFFGIDESGVGYLYTRDGTVKATFADAITYDSFIPKGLLEIYTGTETSKTAHVLDAETLREVYRYPAYDKEKDIDVDMGYLSGSPWRCAVFYTYSAKDPEKEPTVKVVDLKTGKILIDACETANVFIVNGKSYYCAVKDNVTVMADEDGKVLLRMPCTYLD